MLSGTPSQWLVPALMFLAHRAWRGRSGAASGRALLADPDVLLLDEPYAGCHFVVDQDNFDRIVEVKDGLAVPR